MRYPIPVQCQVFLVSIILLMLPMTSAHSQWDDPSPLRGVWQAETYRFQGTEHPMEGLLIFTDRHFAATVRFSVSGGPTPDLNATTGTYRTGGDQVVFVREIAANIRSGDGDNPIRYSPGENEDEFALYHIEGDVLTIEFPSGNHYIARRSSEH